jgi:hypothetical protein
MVLAWLCKRFCDTFLLTRPRTAHRAGRFPEAVLIARGQHMVPPERFNP